MLYFHKDHLKFLNDNCGKCSRLHSDCPFGFYLPVCTGSDAVEEGVAMEEDVNASEIYFPSACPEFKQKGSIADPFLNFDIGGRCISEAGDAWLVIQHFYVKDQPCILVRYNAFIDSMRYPAIIDEDGLSARMIVDDKEILLRPEVRYDVGEN